MTKHPLTRAETNFSQHLFKQVRRQLLIDPQKALTIPRGPYLQRTAGPCVTWERMRRHITSGVEIVK